MRTFKCTLCTMGVALFILPCAAYATLAENLTIGSAKAIALGNAVTADPPGIDSIHFNPAGLTRLKGRQKHFKLMAGGFDLKLKFNDYSPERQAVIDKARKEGYFTEQELYDAAHDSVSSTAGPTVMLPGLGLTDLPFGVGPSGGFSYAPEGERYTIASGIYPVLAGGYHRDEDDPGRWLGERMAFTLLTYFSPSFAYEFSENFSVGAALTFNYAGIGVDLPFREPHEVMLLITEAQREVGCPNSTIPQLPICGSTLSPYEQLGFLHFEAENPMTFGFNMGALWRVQPWLTLGAVYQAPVPMNVHGDFYWNNAPDWNNFVTPLLNSGVYKGADQILSLLNYALPAGKTKSEGIATLHLKMPMHFAIGASIMLTPDLKLNLDYKYAQWSAWKKMGVEFSDPIDLFRIAEILQPDMATKTSITANMYMEDTWNPAMGLEYRYNPNIKLRMGIENRISSLPSHKRTAVIPLGDGYLYGLGVSYETANDSVIDFSLAYFKCESDVPVADKVLGNDQQPYKPLYNPFAGTNMETSVTVKLFEFGYSAHF